MIIDCGTCAVAGAACSDCVVTVLLGIPDIPTKPAATDLLGTPIAAVTVVDDDHAAAISVLAESGLVPPLRLVPRSQAS